MTDSSAAALTVEALTIQYGGFKAVSAVSLEVPRGEVRGLIGPNGAGKTSCFNGICGYVRPSGGTLRVDGREVALNSPYAAWKAGIGRTFQRVELFWSLQVRDHIDLARQQAAKRGVKSPSWDDIAGMLNLADLETELVANLPIGTCRLVELGRAISTGANLILLDEPCSGLDRHETDQLESALRRIQGELGLSLLIVEHDMEFILSIAEHIYVMNYGQVIAEGTPNEIRRDAGVREAYLGGTAEELEQEEREAHSSKPAATTATIAARETVTASANTSDSPVRSRAGALEVTGVSARYDDQVALHGVSIRVDPGSCVAILGTNGAGKTTLLNSIAGLHRPIQGQVVLDGKHIEDMQGYQNSRAGICYIPEGRGVFPDLTVSENLQLSIGTGSSARSRLFNYFPQLKGYLNRPAGTLSGGEQQMVAMAPALVGDYELLLVDELSLGLAPLIVDKLFSVLAEIRASGVSILIVEQFAERALALADRAYVVRKGEIVFDGPASELQHNPDRLSALYLGDEA